MIIKKIAKQCREHRTIISMFKGDTLWVGLSFSIRRWSKTPLVAVRSGFFLVALIAPMSFQTETLKDWCDKQRQLIIDVEDYVAQLALEKAEDEALDESQITMEEE